MKNISFVIVCVTSLQIFQTKAQEMIGLNKSQILKQMTENHAILRIERDKVIGFFPGTYDLLDFSYSRKIQILNDIAYEEIIIKSNGTCFRQFVQYLSNKRRNEIIRYYNNPKLNLKIIEKDKKWINTIRNYQVQLINTISTMKGSIKFAVEIKKIDSYN